MTQSLRLLICALCSVWSFSSIRAQDTITSSIGVKFEVVQDDPSKINKWYIGPDIFGLAVGYSFCFGAGVDVNYLHNQKWWFKFNGYFPYFDSQLIDFSKLEKSNGVPARRSVAFEIGATYHFSNVTRIDNKASVFLDETGGSYERTVTRLKMGVPTEYKMGARFGYFYTQQAFSDGILDIGDTTALGEMIELSGFTNHSIYAGISRTRVKNLVLKSSRYGITPYKGYKTHYFDVLLNVYGATDFKVVNDPYAYSSDLGWRRIGFRLGYDRSFQIKNKKYSFRIGSEFSWRPIPKTPPIYAPISGGAFNLKFGIHFLR